MKHYPISRTIIPWAIEWLYYYEIWCVTGEWQGGGAHPTAKACQNSKQYQEKFSMEQKIIVDDMFISQLEDFSEEFFDYKFRQIKISKYVRLDLLIIYYI